MLLVYINIKYDFLFACLRHLEPSSKSLSHLNTLVCLGLLKVLSLGLKHSLTFETELLVLVDDAGRIVRICGGERFTPWYNDDWKIRSLYNSRRWYLLHWNWFDVLLRLDHLN